MKFVATSAFLNVSSLNIEPVIGSPHEKEIPKGARFSIGKSETFSHLRGEEKEAIANLFVAGRIITADNVIGAALVDKEVEQEKKRAEALAKQMKASNSQSLVDQLVALFASVKPANAK